MRWPTSRQDLRNRAVVAEACRVAAEQQVAALRHALDERDRYLAGYRQRLADTEELLRQTRADVVDALANVREADNRSREMEILLNMPEQEARAELLRLRRTVTMQGFHQPAGPQPPRIRHRFRAPTSSARDADSTQVIDPDATAVRPPLADATVFHPHGVLPTTLQRRPGIPAPGGEHRA